MKQNILVGQSLCGRYGGLLEGHALDSLIVSFDKTLFSNNFLSLGVQMSTGKLNAEDIPPMD